MPTMTITTEDLAAVESKIEAIRAFLAETPAESVTNADVKDLVTDLTDCISLIVSGA